MEEEVAQFNNVLDFSGSYRGSYDGRDARVTIQEGAAGVRSPNTLLPSRLPIFSAMKYTKGWPQYPLP
jgi:hypothetical protein